MKKGLRRAGIVGLSTVVAGSMMTGLATTASAATGTFTAVTQPAVAQSQVAAPAGNLTLEFLNAWNTNASQTFTVGDPNDCLTSAGILRAVKYSAVPTVAVTDPGTANSSTDVAPVITATLGSSDTTCSSLGITNRVTLTVGAPAVGTSTDNWLVTLSNIKYTIGSTTSGAIDNTTAIGANSGLVAPIPATVSNAIIPALVLTNSPARVAALPAATSVSLGTQTLSEGTAGGRFPTGSTDVTLSLTPTTNGTAFTAGVTPTITAPAGYTVTKPATTATTSYTFRVTAPATTVRASVTVAGLTITAPDAPTAPTVVSIRAALFTTATPPVAAGTAGPSKVVNVVKYADRTGGATRYETAAALFNAQFGALSSAGSNANVVLARGDLFPDALSANYLAGKLGTGTLLTTSSTLSSAARQAIISAGVSTVYIVGQTGAVSQNVQNQVEAIHVGNNPGSALINVVRLGGADRYATNLLVNENAFTAEGTVLLASGANFPDALAFGPIAAGNPAVAGSSVPTILTAGTTLGSHEMAQLSDFSPTNVVIGGGTGVVSAAIEAQLKASGYTVLRLAGADRTLTAAAIATWATVGEGVAPFTAIRASRGFDSTTAYVATGNIFADALAAGPVAGATNHVVLLTYSGLGAGIPSYLGPFAVGLTPGNTEVGILHALGLTGAVDNATMKSAAATIEIP